MNRNNMLLIGLAVFFVIGVGLTALMLRSGGQPTPPPNTGPVPTPAPVKTFVAAKDIPPRTVITAAMLEESESKPTAGAITDIDQAVGKLSTEPIYKGQVVKSSMAMEELERVIPASFAIPKENQDNLRAVAIWVDPLQTAAGLVDKGDRVDVIAVHKLKASGSGDASEFAAGRTIAQDLQVLAVDRSLEVSMKPTPVPAPPSAPGAPPPPTPPTAPTPPPTPGQKTFTRVIVAALPETAERLVAANTTGELHITIRDPQVRDNFPIQSVREYPSAPTDPNAQKIREAAVQDVIEARRSKRTLAMDVERRRVMKQFEEKPIPMPTLPPMGFDGMKKMAPPPDVHEITVVRGTEKTRVIVPR